MMFCLLLAGILQWGVFIGLGEMSSAFPSSGGQYHFAYVFAPLKTRNFAAYSTGLINILGWWINTSSGIMYTAISAFGCATFWFPNFAQEPYQVYLVYLAVIVISRKCPRCDTITQADTRTVIPIWLIPQRHIDTMTKASMILSILGMFLTISVCLAMGRGHYAPGSIFTKFQGTSGWNPGTSWLLSIATALYCYSANGAVTHIAEELPDPGKKIPQIL